MARGQTPRRWRRNLHFMTTSIPSIILCISCALCLLTASFAFTSPKCYNVRGIVPTNANYAMKIKPNTRPNRLPMAVNSQIAAGLDPDDSDKQLHQSVSVTSSSESSTTPFVGLPSYKRILVFVATTFMIWVSEPLLSLVDSAMVGRFAGKLIPSASGPDLSSVIQLASLGPATMLCDSSIYLTLFIAMAATNKLATAFAKDDLKEQIRTISHVMGLSLCVGTLLLLVITFQGKGLLATIIGPAGATITVESAKGVMNTVDLTPEVLSAALGYSRIRSAVSPLAVMGLTAQAALLCAQDTKSPSIAVLMASIVNIVGDYIFVAKMRWGVRGAALATSMASATANGFLVRKVWKMMQGWKAAARERSVEKEEQMQPTNQSASQTNIIAENEEASNIPFISFPDQKSLISLLKLAGPLFFVMLGKILGYSSMTVRAGNFGMVSLACHNVLMRIFFFFGTVGDSLSQTAQTFLPGLFYRKSQQENGEDIASTSTSGGGKNARTLLKRFLLISTISGFINCMLGTFIADSSGRAFTTDASLVSLMSKVSPFMGLAQLLHPLTMVLEGSIIAAGDVGFLVATYVASVIVLLGQLKFICKDFLGVWHAILLFQMIRIIQFGARVWRRTASSKAQKATNEG